MQHAAHVTFGEQITLLGYDMAQDEQTLHLDLYWQAGKQIEANYKVFVHLFDPATEAIPVQVDRQPLNGVYPTSWWRAGEVIADQVTLSIADLTPGDYALAVGIYDVDTDVRLDAHTAAGEPLPDGRLILKPTLSILDDE